MPIQNVGILPSFNTINPSAISVPANYGVPDTFNTQLQVYQEIRARENHQIVKDNVEYEKLERRENIRNNVMGFMMGNTGSGTGSGKGKGGAGPLGLTGSTPFSKRVIEEMQVKLQRTIDSVNSTDDIEEMRKLGVQFGADLKYNADYQNALKHEAGIQSILEKFLTASPGTYDDKAVEDALGHLRKVDPITGQINVGTEDRPVNLSPDEMLASIDYTPFNVSAFEADLDGTLTGSDFSDEITLDSGTTGIAKGTIYDSDATRELKILNLLKSNPKAIRHYSEELGISGDDAALQIAKLLSNSRQPNGELQSDGTYRSVSGITNLETELDRQKDRAAIRSSNRANQPKPADAAFTQVYNEVLKNTGSHEEALTRANIAKNAKETNVNYNRNGSVSTGSSVERDKNGIIKSVTVDGYNITKKQITDQPGVSIRDTNGNTTIEVKDNKGNLQWLKDNNLAPESLNKLKNHEYYDAGEEKVIIPTTGSASTSDEGVSASAIGFKTSASESSPVGKYSSLDQSNSQVDLTSAESTNIETDSTNQVTSTNSIKIIDEIQSEFNSVEDTENIINSIDEEITKLESLPDTDEFGRVNNDKVIKINNLKERKVEYNTNKNRIQNNASLKVEKAKKITNTIREVTSENNKLIKGIKSKEGLPIYVRKSKSDPSKYLLFQGGSQLKPKKDLIVGTEDEIANYVIQLDRKKPKR